MDKLRFEGEGSVKSIYDDDLIGMTLFFLR